ncbi:head maturation protease, ClpP-related [Clostridium senegalense]
MNNKFYEIKNKSENEIDIMVYGEIISGSDKWDESDVTYKDFSDSLSNLKGNETVNLYVNSCGGSVIATQGIVAMLQRAKDKGVIINSYIDGIGASCSSFLPLVGNNVYAYNSSLLMVHKPYTITIGNANDLKEQINILDKIENNVMMPIYMSKAKEGVTEEYLRDLISKETWLNAKEMAEIFNITILEENKELVAFIKDKDILKNYKNIPKALENKIESKIIENTVKDNEENGIKNEYLKAKLELLLL